MRLLITLALVALAAPAVAAPFTMTCTSGGSMTATVTQSQGRRAGAGSARVVFRYKKARQGANEAAPAQGQCAWAHRGLNDREGESAGFKPALAGFSTVKAGPRGLEVRFSDDNLDKLMKHVSKPGQRFSLIVANKAGRLEIEKVH
ncbi:MAG: hypothetical protein H6702_11830 [Myxococcales bacterium]|nr:hypothetical protein [Myxococcales bacterium]